MAAGYDEANAENIITVLANTISQSHQAAQVSVGRLPSVDDAIRIIKEVSNGARDVLQPKWYKYAFDLAIILCVVVPILTLGLTGRLNETTLGTLFGGIIGYTLARFKKGVSQ